MCLFAKEEVTKARQRMQKIHDQIVSDKMKGAVTYASDVQDKNATIHDDYLIRKKAGRLEKLKKMKAEMDKARAEKAKKGAHQDEGKSDDEVFNGAASKHEEPEKESA